ncbi:hypothetical protein ACH5RR_025568 [Cinchona calisaya]|uniref:Uncharacterized protein n=1 Tax=Cinchona calisaya TaxID=153742 RepID=A0ABD2Z0I3_9GENT
MPDLGASINVMSYSVYDALKIGPLNKIGIVIQLADRSLAYPKGIVEDILVQVGSLVFSVDFYVLKMEQGDYNTPILLGRPFLATSQTKIDVLKGNLSMKFGDKIVNFSIYDDVDPSDHNKLVSVIDVCKPPIQKIYEHTNNQEEDTNREEHLKEKNMDLLHQTSNKSPNVFPLSNEELKLSVMQGTIPDYNHLPSHLKYIFLKNKERVIISNQLSKSQEEQLVRVLQEQWKMNPLFWCIVKRKILGLLHIGVT